MKPVRLRAHHLDILYQTQKVALGDAALEGMILEERNPFMALLYGESFKQSFIKFSEEVKDDTLIEVVSGNDDICHGLRCPYSKYCGSGDYSSTMRKITERLPPGTDPAVIGILGFLTPEVGDRWACRKYGLEIGREYRFGEIKIVEENIPLGDFLNLDDLFDKI